MSKKDILFAKAVSGSGSSGSSLPEVTTGDNGKVLTVVEGAWDKADAPSNVVIFDIEYKSTFLYSLKNATRQDLENVIASGKIPVLRDATSTNTTKYYYLSQKASQLNYPRCFVNLSYSQDTGWTEYRGYVNNISYPKNNLTSADLDFTSVRIALYSDLPTT